MGAYLIIYTALLLLASNTLVLASVGTPPIFVNEPPVRVSVSLGQFKEAGSGVVANLVLPCGVTGNPTPMVQWFFGEGPFSFGIISVNTLPDSVVLANGTLALNVTEQLIPRRGTNFYCEASNMIGENGTTRAALRSKNVNVTRTFFAGFAAAQPNNISLDTVEGGAVAMLCDILQGIPTPAIQWFADDVLVEENREDESILFIDNARYLFIRQLTVAQRAARFHCSVTTFEGEVLRDPNTYTLSNDITTPNFIVQYQQSGTIFPMVTADIGEPVTLVYAAASVDAVGNNLPINLSCPSVPELSLSMPNTLVITAVLQPPAANLTFPEVIFQCWLNGFELPAIIHVSLPPVVLFPLPGVGPDVKVIMDRERVVGGGPVTYSCASNEDSGSLAAVRWFRNNVEITFSGFLGGTFLDPETLFFMDPQVEDSALYQCFVTDFNTNMELTRAWFLEVRESIPPSPTDDPVTLTAGTTPIPTTPGNDTTTFDDATTIATAPTDGAVSVYSNILLTCVVMCLAALATL